MNAGVAQQFAGRLVDAEMTLSAALDGARTALGLQQAAAIIAAKNPDGHISEASIRRLIIEAVRLRRPSTT